MFTSIILFAAWKILVSLFLTFIYLAPFLITGFILVVVATGLDDEIKIRNPKATVIVGIPLLILALAGFVQIWKISGGARAELLESYTQFAQEEVPVTELSYGTEIQRFTLVSYNPPKHMYVTLKRSDGTVYENLYVSKHCTTLPEVGKEYNVPIIKYSFSNAPLDVKAKWPNLYPIFCE